MPLQLGYNQLSHYTANLLSHETYLLARIYLLVCDPYNNIGIKEEYMAKLSIVGTGLIGTSIALALKEANINDLDIVGTDYSRDSRIGAQKSGGFDKIENRLLNAVKDADIVILAVPVMAMEETMTYIASDLKEG